MGEIGSVERKLSLRPYGSATACVHRRHVLRYVRRHAALYIQPTYSYEYILHAYLSSSAASTAVAMSVDRKAFRYGSRILASYMYE